MADCVIIGGGAAGMQAARTCRREWPDKSVTVIDTEPEIGYYRTLIPQFMNRTLTEDKLFFWRLEDDPGLDVITGASVEGMDRDNRALFLDNRQTLLYQRLIIATGGRPIVPPICRDETVQGVFPIRSLSVARAARSWLDDHPEIVILGGGLVGVKTAVHLAAFNYSVTLVEKENRLLPLSLSSEASKLIEAHLQGKNIRLMLGSTVDDLQGANGAVQSVSVNGQRIPCETLFVAAGSVPELGFLRDSNLLKDGTLEVDPHLQTGDKNIFAAGDVATIIDKDRFTPWTWPQAVVQGRCAAENLYDDAPRPLSCLSRVNAMNLNGLSLVILGGPVAGSERIVYDRSENGIYRELFQTDGRIVGGALVGNITNAGRLHEMLNGGRVETGFENLLEPRIDSFWKRSPSLGDYRKQATILVPQGA